MLFKSTFTFFTANSGNILSGDAVVYNVHVHVSIVQSIYTYSQSGASIPPPTPWSKFPLTLPLAPFPPLRSRPPLLRLGGLGERFSSPSGSGRSPAAKRYLVNFRLKISPLAATIFRSFSGNETSNWGDWVAEW